MTTTADATAVEAAIAATVRDYFGGYFEADVERMRRALPPQLTKRTLEEGASGADLWTTTADRMLALTAGTTGARGAATDTDSERPAFDLDRDLDIQVIDRHRNIATVVVRSTVYREYLHLVHADGSWKIVNALWQST